MIKKLLIGLCIALGLLVAGSVYAAPPTTFSNNLLPSINDAFDLGSTTPALEWLHGYFSQVCIQNDCRTVWPVSTATFGTTSISALFPLVWNTSTAQLSSLFSTTTNWRLGSNGVVTVGASGIPYVTASSSLNLPNTALQNSTISGIALGSNLSSLTISSPLTGSSYNGSAGVSIGCQTASGSQAGCLSSTDWNTFNTKPPYQFTPSTFGAINVSATTTAILDYPGLIAATSTFGTIVASSSITNQAVTSALVLNGSAGLEGAYGGTSCTNQFVRSLNALGSATCATVSAADVSLANLTATDSTLTFSGTYNGSTARTIGLNLGNANIWTALQQFNGQASSTAESTRLFFAGGTATTSIAANGAITSVDAMTTFSGIVSPVRQLILSIGTSTATWTATSTAGNDSSPTTPLPFNGTIKTVRCKLNTFLGINIQISGANVTPSYFVASSTMGTTTLTAGNTFSNADYININAGTTTSATASSGVVQGSCILDIVQTS